MTTNNHPAHAPVSLERLHQIRQYIERNNQYQNGGNIAYILADMLKVIDGAIDGVIVSFGAEPYGYVHKDIYESCGTAGLSNDRDAYRNSDTHIALYTAPPEPVLPEEMYWQDAPVEGSTRAAAYATGWNACRAAMLQAGNSTSKCSLRDGIEAIRNSGIPVDVDKIQSECEADNHTEQHLDMVGRSGCANEKVDCRLTFDQWLSQQNEPIDVDCGCVTTEAFYHWLRVAYEASNSPVLSPIDHGYRPDCECSGCIATARICEELAANPPVTPDTWIPVSERMPPSGGSEQRYVLAADFRNHYWPNIPNTQVGVYGDWFNDGNPTWDDGDGEDLHLKEVTHWMPLPAAP
ncbi:MAG: DUF551 domain-containing protein, partial [Plesiomonas shigelloides]